jgi:catechol 2,3-dioxygenase-like lactoylglutathione lyase family enzyme
MRRVTGIGGIFFKSRNPEKLYQWYERHLGLKRKAGDAVVFGSKTRMTVWSLFPKNTTHFHPSRASFMINYRVVDLDRLLELLGEEDVKIDEHREDSEYRRFAWIMDPEGNRIELWEPPEKGDVK